MVTNIIVIIIIVIAIIIIIIIIIICIIIIIIVIIVSTAIWLFHNQLWATIEGAASLVDVNHCVFDLFQPEGHRKPRNEVGS